MEYSAHCKKKINKYRKKVVNCNYKNESEGKEKRIRRKKNQKKCKKEKQR